MIAQSPSKRQRLLEEEASAAGGRGGAATLDGDQERENALRRIADECLAGRLITRARLCKQVKNALETLGWRKESVKVRAVQLPSGEEEPGGQRTLALALAPAGVRGVQQLLSHGETCGTLHLRQEGSTAQQQQQPLGGGTQESAARELLSSMLCEGSVRLSLGLPCDAELGQAFPPSASAPKDAALFKLPPIGSLEHSRTNGAEKHKFTFAELFAGIGGFRLGLESIGGRCVLMAERDRFCHLTVRKNFSQESVAKCLDVTELCAIDVPPHHILTAGFPCQSFSQLGARHGGRDSGADERRGLNDETKGILIWHVLRIASATR